MNREAPLLPTFHYYLDESDPDILILRRQDDFFVAAFSARGATREGIVEAAREDYKSLLEPMPSGEVDETHDDAGDARLRAREVEMEPELL